MNTTIEDAAREVASLFTRGPHNTPEQNRALASLQAFIDKEDALEIREPLEGSELYRLVRGEYVIRSGSLEYCQEMKLRLEAKRTNAIAGSNKMKPLQRASLDPDSKAATIAGVIEAWKRRDPAVIATIAEDATLADVEAAARKICDDLEQDDIWMNDTYQVNVRDCGEMVHLSIKRLDKEAIRDWRDFQEIKNQLVGPENEGIELYPAESRLCDSANQYHLWVLKDPTARLPVGWNVRAVTNSTIGNSKQRPRE